MTLNGEMALILRYFYRITANLVISGAYCVNVVDKTITVDNLRLFCVVVNVCQGPRDALGIKFLSDS